MDSLNAYNRPLKMTCTRQTLFWLVFLLSASSWAQHEQAILLDGFLSYIRMAEELLLPAEQGHPDAQTRLAEMYERGLGVPQNFNKAIGLYRKAALNGYPPALVKLRSLGVGVFAEPTTAIEDTSREAKNKTKPSTQITIKVGRVTLSGSSLDLWSPNRIILTRVIKEKPRTRRKPFMAARSQANHRLLFSTQSPRPGFKVTGTN